MEIKKRMVLVSPEMEAFFVDESTPQFVEKIHETDTVYWYCFSIFYYYFFYKKKYYKTSKFNKDLYDSLRYSMKVVSESEMFDKTKVYFAKNDAKKYFINDYILKPLGIQDICYN
jgi:hypothetical protein